MMPYEFTSNMSLEDSKLQAHGQEVQFSSIDIHTMVDSYQFVIERSF